jgi:2-iminobutanoate/2-iminopropanoate deaminase
MIKTVWYLESWNLFGICNLEFEADMLSWFFRNSIKRGERMKKRIVQTDKAPQAIGPYSQAIRAGDFLFLSGQIPLDPKTGDLVKGDIRQQTKQVLENIKGILESQELGMKDLVKITIFLKDIENFSQVNEVYSDYFPDFPPARSTVEVARLPRAAEIEIEAIALI